MPYINETILAYIFKVRVQTYEHQKYLANQEANILRERNRRQQLKLEILSHYSGGTPKCLLCGFDDIRALSIDHIDGGGTKHRNQAGLGGVFYYWLRKNNFPDGYQVLCMNCQFIKQEEMKEYRGNKSS